MIPRGALRSLARLRVALPLVALCSMACPTTTTPKAPTAPHTVSTPSPEPLSPARWVEVGTTQIGPTLREGTLVLLGGRRVLVTPEGAVKTETVPAPERLLGVAAVATKSGMLRVVAHGEHGIYRLDDSLLGEPIALAHTGEGVTVERIGAGPDGVAVWDSGSDTPSYMDAETGSVMHPNMPTLPPSKMAFRNSQEGVGLFPAVGLAITIDGGKQWSDVGGPNLMGDLEDLKLTLRGIVATRGARKQDKFIDWGTSSVGLNDAKSDNPPPKIDPPVLLEWIGRTQKNPLVAAVENGVLLPSGDGLVAASGLVAQVDLMTGLIRKVPTEGGRSSDSLFLVRSGDSVWLSGQLPRVAGVEGDDEKVEGFGVCSVAVREDPIKLEKRARKLNRQSNNPVLDLSGEKKITAAPSGAVMVWTSCDDENGVCVRQRDGLWRSVRPEVTDLEERGAGPLSNGRVAYLRGLSMEEAPPRDLPLPPKEVISALKDAGLPAQETDLPAPNEGPKQPPGPRSVWIVTMDPSGDETTVATIPLPKAELVDVSVQGNIEEVKENRLRVLLQPAGGDPTIVTVDLDPSQRPAKVDFQALTSISKVVLRDRFGVKIAGENVDESLSASTDGGATWSKIEIPASLRGKLRSSAQEALMVSEVGFQLGPYVRIGWGAQEPFPTSRPTVGGIELPTKAIAGEKHTIHCMKNPEARKGVAPSAPADLLALMAKDQLAIGMKRTEATPARRPWPHNGWVFVEGPSLSEQPTNWNFFWFDPADLDDKPRSAHGKAPTFQSWNPVLEKVASSGERALFFLHSDFLRSRRRKDIVIHTKGASIESAVVPSDVIPGSSERIVFGADSSQPIAWVNEDKKRVRIVVWNAGDAPRLVATLQTSAEVWLGQPTKGKLPVMMLFRSMGLFKTIDLPKKSGSSLLKFEVNGWTPFTSDLTRLPVCKGTKGYRFLVPSPQNEPVKIGGKSWKGAVVYELRAEDGQDICVAGLTVTLHKPPALQTITAKLSGPPRGGSAPKPPAAKTAPIDFLHYDLARGRAEGGHFGSTWGTRPTVHNLTCTYDVVRSTPRSSSPTP